MDTLYRCQVAQVYRSEDSGNTWAYVNTYNNLPFYYEPGAHQPKRRSAGIRADYPFTVSADYGKRSPTAAKTRRYTVIFTP